MDATIFMAVAIAGVCGAIDLNSSQSDLTKDFYVSFFAALKLNEVKICPASKS